MASAPSDPRPVLGRVDRDGRLMAADPELAALQSEAGANLGEQLALPQIAEIARLARDLGVELYRPAIAAGEEQDVELWVRATPDGDDVLLSLDRFSFRPPAPARIPPLSAADQQLARGTAPDEWATDQELRFTALSSSLAEKLGSPPEGLVGQSLTRLFRLEEDESGELPLLGAVAARTRFADQRARVRSEGGVSLLLAGEPVMTAEGAFAGFKGTAVDIAASAGPRPASEDRVLDAALDEALRSPLDRIISCADTMLARSDGPLRSDYAEYASDISAAARHLLSVIRSMNEAPEKAHDRIDVAVLAAEACAMLDPTAEQRGIALAVAPTEPLLARGETRGVMQILVNLIGNAVRHSPDTGIVAISFERSESMAFVHVIDQGPGIDSADHERIFEPFQQASQSGGTGLGLAIARRLARGMGGEISVQSAPGEGARFTLSLSAD